MKITNQLDLKTYIRLNFILTFRRPLLAVFMVIGFLNLVYVVLLISGVVANTQRLPLFQLVFGLYIVIFLPLVVYYKAKKNFQNNLRVQEPIVYEFTDETIKLTGESFNTEFTWEKTHKVIELKNWMLIYQNNLVANAIEKKNFGDQLQAFRDLVNSKSYLKSKLMNS